MSDIQRKLASVRKITDIRPIPDADAIECAMVGGWPVVVKKGEFFVGDLAVYFEIDSWIPHELAPFLSKGKEPREYNGVKGERLSTVKLRGQVSQGLLLNMNETLETEWSHSFMNFEGARSLQEGDDLTELFSVQKWEAPVPAYLAGKVRGNFPSYIPKTDQKRCQNIENEIFEKHKGERYEATVKLDGSSCTVYVKDGRVGVCSRKLDLIETEENSFWRAARAQNLIDALTELYDLNGSEIALQMELIGEGIQKNQEGLKGQRLYLFDVFNIETQSYMEPWLRRLFLKDILIGMFKADLEHAPVVEESIVVTDRFANVEELLAYADGPSMNPNAKREGIVFKSLDSDFTFKAISNQWLLKTRK